VQSVGSPDKGRIPTAGVDRYANNSVYSASLEGNLLGNLFFLFYP